MNRKFSHIIIVLITILYSYKALTVESNQNHKTLTLWGAQHGLVGEYPTECSKQADVLVSLIQEKQIEIKIPQFLMTLELVDKKIYTSPLIGGADDLFLAQYAGFLFAYNRSFKNIYNEINANGGLNQDYDHYVKLFNDYLKQLNGIDSKIFEKINDIFIRDQNKPYVKNIERDLRRFNGENVPKENENSFIHRIDEYLIDKSPAKLEVVLSGIDSYRILTMELAKFVYNKHILTNPNKYNMFLSDGGEGFKKLKTFDYAYPENIFSIENANKGFAVDSIGSMVLVYWRNAFIVKNIISYLKNDKYKHILSWMGEAHLDFVAKALINSNEISEEMKNNITVINDRYHGDIACDYENILESIHLNQNMESLLSYNLHFINGIPIKVYNLQNQLIGETSIINPESVEIEALSSSINYVLTQKSSPRGGYIVLVTYPGWNRSLKRSRINKHVFKYLHFPH